MYKFEMIKKKTDHFLNMKYIGIVQNICYRIT